MTPHSGLKSPVSALATASHKYTRSDTTEAHAYLWAERVGLVGDFVARRHAGAFTGSSQSRV